MEEAKYVFNTVDAELRKEETHKIISILKKVVWIIVGVIIIGSIIFRENLFMGLSWSTRMLLISLVIYTFFIGSKSIWMEVPIELQFFEEYLIVYRPSYYYTKKVTRREYNTMKYSEISRILFRKDSQRINIYGDVHIVWYLIDVEGNIGEKPTDNRRAEGAFQVIETRFMKNMDIIDVLEKYTNKKVEIENT